MKPQKHVFATFPEFSRLTLADREKWENLIKDYPPIYDISFSGLLTWWNSLGNMKVSQLNENLIIPYWIPGDEENSGLSIIGKTAIDESICEVFDYLRSRNEPVRLINVPEFVIQQIKYHDIFSITELRRVSEYTMPLSHFYPLKNMAPHWRKRVERSIKQFGVEHIVAASVDLDTEAGKLLLLEAIKWRSKNPLNDFGSMEEAFMSEAIQNAQQLGVENLCLYVNGQLRGFCLYEVPADKRYVNIKHIKSTHASTLGFELIGYAFAKWFMERGFSYVNLGPDYDIDHLRIFMVAMGADNFFRKYTITPKA